MEIESDAWEPFSVDEAVDLFTGAPFRWWISGGHAFELHVGQVWRPHQDLDIGIRRDQAAPVFEWLSSWAFHIAAAGRLSEWDGRPLSAERHENNVWARRSPQASWSFDLTVGDGTDDGWIYRRDPTLSLPWSQAVLRSSGSVPYLAPELQLLFKSKNPRPKDDLDAERVIPILGAPNRQFLRDQLPTDHRWQDLLG